ncbi:MAG TPA: type IV pilus twitching motility protein PilT [bacterium]|nr:type IV pilus twitching motility protein PilT [bacterium]
MIGIEQIQQLLTHAVRNQSSDIHLSQGYPPILRIDGKLQPIKGKVLTHQDLEDIIVQILDDYQMERFKKELELDFGYSIDNVAHFRVNVFSKLGGFGMAFRIIPSKIRSLEELGMPAGVISLARQMEGLILVTGPTGHGKSTTLAAMIDMINQERRSHVLTIEDPIEYTHTPKNCLIQQRELGHHTHSFAAALRSALREDPDVILVGEMRDLETISLALTAAETGHLVLSTLHTRNAPDTINRIIDVFPAEQQTQILAQISSSLLGVVSQRLVNLNAGVGRVAAVEVMIATSAIRNMIRERKTHQIRSIMQSSTSDGMQTMDEHLLHLLNTGKISRQDAVKYALEIDRFIPKTGKEKSR